MLREFKFLGRYSTKNSEIEERENVPINPKESLVTHTSTDPTRAPLNTIPEPIHNYKTLSEQEISVKNKKNVRTPVKDKGKISDTSIPLRTPEKYGFSSKNRFGWAQKSDPQDDTSNYNTINNTSKGVGGFSNVNTPKSTRTIGKANLNYSENNSTQSTPTKSVSKPPNSALFLASVSRPPVGNRIGNYMAMSKGIPINCNNYTIVNTVEVPHFNLKEDSSFWMEHNVQVVIRVRPLNNNERSANNYNRCLKQESAQCITWIGHPETRFTFDHVACETVDQETLFRMVGLPMVENCLSGYHSCVFAYGQTGSGKTHTMLGEMEGLEVRPSPNRGMTARIFEFLFARIRAEEEIRRDERLKYSCRCSFLEIYNEQITDLLEPSATNLQLREDAKNGVYVENLSEFEVETVGDILKLLSQGSSNRRVATTNMNRESSRSHSVFTCIIESIWEKDATTNSRFARMNLVDLAGSERQKSSGAEGERLKEAAGINKSLSTLGHVIMMLVDIAQGKPRHVPYRDSRLTFLLQDSLGGNSKTMIIANVSPSICCAAETLNTLKFAQRAKLIQNNAIVNEDSSGDVTALRNQIRQLKEELNALKRQNVSRTLSFAPKALESEDLSDLKAIEIHQQRENNLPEIETKGSRRLSSKQMKSFETTLAGALRREQMSEISIRKLEAEIEQLNRLVREKEEYSQCTKMMLKLREEKIQRMESLVGGLIPADNYLVEENSALSAEIKLLQAKVDKNPEVTRFAMEYDRVLEQVRNYQDFYEEGEREMLIAEVSELRNQLVHLLDSNSKQDKHPKIDMSDQEALRNTKAKDTRQLEVQLNKTFSELEECRNSLNSCLERNERLTREIEDLRATVSNLTAPYDHDSGIEVIKESIVEAPTLRDQPLGTIHEDNSQMKYETLMKPAEDIMNLELEVDILKQILKEERSSRANVEEKELGLNQDLQITKEKLSFITKKYEDANEELKEAKSVIEALESQQLFTINEIEDLKNSNSLFAEIISEKETEISNLKEQISYQELRDPPPINDLKNEDSPLVVRLKKMQKSLEKAKELNTRYQNDYAFNESNEEEMDEIRKQVEAETAEVIICLQDELADLQKQVQDSNLKETQSEEKIYLLDQDNAKLSEKLQEKEKELKELSEKWELLTKEIETGLQKEVQDSSLKETESEEKIYLLDQDNKILSEKLQEKEKELKELSENWELLSREIEIVLISGNEELEEASDQIEFSFGSPLKKEYWVSDKVEKIRKIITEKEIKIHELNRCLEDANYRTNDLEGMLRSLRGATLVITEAHQQECDKKEREIIDLNAELSSKAFMIEELENKIRSGKEQLEKTALSATAAFVIVKRLSEINYTNIDALDALTEAYQQECNEKQREIIDLNAELSSKAFMIEELENKIISGKEQLEKTAVSATAAFVIVNRLSEINSTNAYALTEKYQQACNEKQREIIDLNAELSSKAFMIEELENKIISGKEQLEKTAVSATAAFVIVNRLSEINSTNAYALTEKYQQACNEKQKEILVLNAELSSKAFLIEELENKIISGKELLDKTLLSATAAFVIVNRLSEVNSTNIDAFDALKKEILALNEQISLKAYAIEELEKQIRLGEELLEKTATSATVAFVIVNRLSEINSTNIDALKVKDENICNLGVEINGAETLIYSLRRELNISGESCDEIRMQLSIEQQRACAMENKLLEIEENEILKTSEKLAELKSGVSTLRSSMDIYASNKDDVISHKDKSEAHAGRETKACENAVESCALGKDMEIENSGFFYKDASDRDRDNTIILLRKEIESALESLKEVQAEMAKLRKEKEEVMMYERSCQESTKSVVNKLVLLKQAMSNFEEQIRSNMGVLDHKLLSVEDTVQEIRSFRCQEKELLESELGDAKAIAAQRSAEASCIYAKFEEAQDTVREADIMINELMIANETSKLKIKGMKKKKATLTEENGVLSRQVQSLQSTIEMKDLHYDNLEKKSISDLLEMNNLVSDLEGIIAEIQSISNKEFASLAHDFLGMKGQFQDSTKLIRSWVEEIWSEIVIKDCAVSVLHLCHMGLFLESVNGLNTENALLNRGLSESNSVINELKEYNVKSRSEIEMCRILKGKLLADMKKGLDRISKKEDETGELTVKLAGFQKKILDLQEQEELMLEKSDHMGFELSALMKELDQSNGSIFNSLQENENLLKNREEFLESLEENYMIDLCAKDFELFILASNFERETLIFYENFEKMKRHIIFSMIDTELKEQSLLEREDEIALLTKEIDEEKKIGQDLISKITERDSTIEQIVKLKEALESDVQLLRNSAILSENLKSQLGEVMEKNKSMLSQIENFEGENHRLQEVVKAKEMELQMAFTRISAIDNNKKALEDELLLQKASLDKVLNELKEKELELITMCCLKTEKKSAESESRKLKESYCSVFKNMEVKNSELLLKIKHCFDSLENLNVVGSKISDAVGGEIFQQISESLHITDNFVEELEIMENSVSEILTENLSLQTELLRKDDVLNGLLFDLHMLQESASSKKDQKDEIEELVASLVDLENELAQRTREHDEAVENSGIFEAELKEKIEIISSLRLDISKLNESINSLSSENLELTYNFQSALDAKKSVEEELFETRKLNEALEREHEEMSSALSDISNSLESFKCDLKDVSCERDGLQEEILIVKRQLEIAEALAEENEAIATEAQEIAESRKVYAEEKEDEIKLLEMSMEELGKTLDITGNKVNIIQEEAERQRLQREELEIELDSLRDQISNVKCVDVDMKRHLGEKERECQEALEKIQILEKEIVAKDAEISQCKAHITELNLHAEAQARDYKQNFKALESMAEQKPEGLSTHGTNSSSSKLEKNGSKPRGSGSPFKCIGLGLSQQIKSEKDEELNASRLRIEELEVLAANRQKEVFTLKAKLATTDSMTHDLLRELTGLKLNLNKYTYLLDNELLQKITEKPGVQDFEYQFKDQEVIKLKQQLSEFVEERKGWLEEIDKKQAEMVAAQVALEELRQRERLLSTENEMIKMEYANYKRKINELEMEIKKLSGQQNLQQRIHHHAKIKEENNLLKSQNEELIVRLRRMDSNLTRVKEVVAKTRLANGRSPDINFEEENRLNQLLKETEEERLQLAQKLVGLCTNILKAAGVTRPASNVSISAAEEALDQIKNRITSLERELQDAKLRNRISSEKIRLSELKPQNSPMSPKSDEYRPVFKAPHSPFLSSLDR